MYWTVEPDRGRVVEIQGVPHAREADRFLVVRWANGTGTIEVDCPSQGSARREMRRLQGYVEEYQRRVPAGYRDEAHQDAKRDQLGDSDQLSLLVD